MLVGKKQVKHLNHRVANSSYSMVNNFCAVSYFVQFISCIRRGFTLEILCKSHEITLRVLIKEISEDGKKVDKYFS